MRKAEIFLEFQNYIDGPPVSPKQLFAQAASNDEVTINTWRDQWISQIKANREKFGPFKENGIGQLFGRYARQPVIVAGSGPSLRYNAHELVNKRGIPVISCLHNFHYLEDLGVEVDYYVTLDAGAVTIEEVYEGGSKPPEHYWEKTRDRTLLAYIGTHPELLSKWRGKVLFFNAPVPDQAFIDAVAKIDNFNTFVSTGGNVLGACFYIAKAILGANPLCTIGADFSFSYEKKFHAWDSKYDKKVGYVIRDVDVYGNKVFTWQSYKNFKCWFESFACRVPGLYINATEGGCLGSYPDGNIMQIMQMTLKGFIEMYNMHEHIRNQCENPETAERKLLF